MRAFGRCEVIQTDGGSDFKNTDQPLAQQRAGGYLDYYHNRQSHLALDMMTPAQFAVSHLR